jgi:RimJ/RimL family protein N-acetyltransferase
MVARVVRALARRTVRRTEVLVLRAEGLVDRPVPPTDVSLLRLQGADARAATAAAMRMAGDRPDLVDQMLAQGDEFFGWQAPDRTIVSFGWARFRGRSIGPVAFSDRSGRTFLYNFHTLPAWRGRNLYPNLISQMRWALTAGGAREFIIDVNARNAASRRGIEKAGFVLVATVSYLTLFRRWDRAMRTSAFDPQLFEQASPR